MTNNEWLALIIGMLIGIGACVVVFLIGLRICNTGKNEKRTKNKLISQQHNIGNRIYHAVHEAGEQNCSVHITILHLRPTLGGESIDIFSGDSGPICRLRINLFIREFPIVVNFPEKNLEVCYDKSEDDIRRLIQTLQEFVANYSSQRHMPWDDGNIA